MFLLCAADRNQDKLILQQLLVLSFDQSKPTAYLTTWAKSEKNWKNILLEALCLIQAKRILHELGLNYEELEQRYFPSHQYDSINIHRIVKLLYYICEEMTVKECKHLIEHMMKKFPSIRNFMYSDNGEHLEMYLMHWLWEGVIDIGTNEYVNDIFLVFDLWNLQKNIFKIGQHQTSM